MYSDQDNNLQRHFKITLDSINTLVLSTSTPVKMLNLLREYLDKLELLIPDIQVKKLTPEELSWEIKQ